MYVLADDSRGREGGAPQLGVTGELGQHGVAGELKAPPGLPGKRLRFELSEFGQLSHPAPPDMLPPISAIGVRPPPTIQPEVDLGLRFASLGFRAGAPPLGSQSLSSRSPFSGDYDSHVYMPARSSCPSTTVAQEAGLNPSAPASPRAWLRVLGHQHTGYPPPAPEPGLAAGGSLPAPGAVVSQAAPGTAPSASASALAILRPRPFSDLSVAVADDAAKGPGSASEHSPLSPPLASAGPKPYLEYYYYDSPHPRTSASGALTTSTSYYYDTSPPRTSASCALPTSTSVLMPGMYGPAGMQAVLERAKSETSMPRPRFSESGLAKLRNRGRASINQVRYCL